MCHSLDLYFPKHLSSVESLLCQPKPALYKDTQFYEVFCFPWHCWSLETDRSEWIQTQSVCFPWMQRTCSMCFCSLIGPTWLVSHPDWKSCQGLHLWVTSARYRKADELRACRGIMCDFNCSMNLFHWIK